MCGGVKRLVTVTGLGAGDSRGLWTVLLRSPSLVLKRIYDDKDAGQMIRASGLGGPSSAPGF
jgi:hypothetical protein